MPHLLVIGANGVLGTTATKFFLSKGFNVSAFVRDKNKAADLENSGATILTGDITDRASLQNIFSTVDAVLTAAHGMLGKGKNSSKNVDEIAHKDLIDYAKQAGVKHFVYTSVFAASSNHIIDFFRAKHLIEEYLIKSGLTYTILKLPAFIEWHAYNLSGKGIVEKGKTTIFGSGTHAENFIAVKDVVVALDKIVLNEEYYNRSIPLAGPENISKNEVAVLFGNALNIQPRVSHVPTTALKALSFVIRPFHPGIARVIKLAVWNERSDQTMNTDQSIAQFGLKPTHITEFIELVINQKKYFFCLQQRIYNKQ